MAFAAVARLIAALVCCPAANGSPLGLLDEFGDHSRPTGLVACTDPGAVVAVEVFVEWDQIAPVRDDSGFLF